MKNIKNIDLGNFLLIFFSDIFSKAILFWTSIYIAKQLGKEAFGLLNYAQVLGSYIFLVSTFGLGQLLSRELKHFKKNPEKLLWNVTVLRISFGLIILVIFIGSWEVFSNRTMDERYIIYLFLIASVSMNFDIPEAYDYYNKGKIHSLIKIFISNLLYFLLVVYILIYYKNEANKLLLISLAYLFSVLIFSVFNWLHFIKKILKTKVKPKSLFEWNLIKSLMLMAVPIALARFWSQVYNNVDIVMLANLKGDISVAIYSAAYKIIFLVMVIEIAFSRIVTPKIVHSINKSFIETAHTLNSAVVAKAFYLLPIAIGGMAVSQELIHFIYGKGYDESVFVLQILFIWIILQILNPVGIYLFASNQNKKYLFHIMLGGVINIILNFLWIPVWNYTGSALATVISGVLVEGVKILLCKELFKHMNWLKHIGLFMMNSLIMAALVKLLELYFNNVFLLIFFGIVIYGLLNLPFYRRIKKILKV